MKNIIRITMVLFSITFCNAQEPVTAIYDGPNIYSSGHYLKDVDNDFDTFIGEWKWENSNSSLTIQFQKTEMHYNPRGDYFNYYSDYLIGDYKYVENSVEEINTLPINFNGNKLDHQIWGNIITTMDRGFPPCEECTPNTRFIFLYLFEPDNPNLTGKIRMAHFVENDVEKIRMRITLDFINNTPDYSGPTELTIPEGIYTFIKQ